MPFPTTTSNTNNNCTAGLIVDFPFNRASSRNKSVSFSSTSQVRLFRHPSTRDNAMKSYTKSDYRRFASQRNADTFQCLRMLSEKLGSLSKKETCMCVGLEPFLAPDLNKRLMKLRSSRKEHVQAVLSEQRRQKKMNINDEDAIALVSKKSSYKNRLRSYKLAFAAASVQV
jgi:hypothetical protein